jgi:5'-nucleotidase
MRFLVTNDDGYLAPGIGLLTAVASRLGDVDVVAPDREQSATSHSLTMHRPLRVRRVREGALVVDGTPTDCVVLALGELLDEPPDFVLSGVNHGSNMGDDVLYSGTVAAAMEAIILGVPAVAISYASGEPDPPLDEGWEEVLAGLLRQIVSRAEFPRETLINVNLPPVPAREVQGARVTVLGRRAYDDSLTRAVDPSGREYFWIGGGESRWWGSERSDFAAVRDGFISMTPLHLDLTNHRLIEDLETWSLTAP